MATFEEVGQAVDREVERLRHFFETEVRPSTQRQLVTALRAASKRLEELAEKLDAHDTGPAPGGGTP